MEIVITALLCNPSITNDEFQYQLYDEYLHFPLYPSLFFQSFGR